MPELSWTPVRSGTSYGSPACCGGRLCTIMAHDQAAIEVAVLAERLGAGWKPRVWENLGWHYSVSKGQIDVHPSRDGSRIRGGWKVSGYTAFFSGHKPGKADTPEAAVAMLAPPIREQIAKLETALTTLKEQR